MKKLIEKALRLVLKGRRAKTIREKDEVLDGLWELIVNIEYEIEHKWRPSEN